MSDQLLPDATRGERVRSAAATVGATIVVGIGATLVVGIGLFVYGVVTKQDVLTTGIGVTSGTPGPFGPANASTWRAISAIGPTWVAPVSLGLVGLIAWLGSCRFGKGTPGDGFMSLTVRTTDGAPVPRWRNMLRTALPFGLFVVGLVLSGVWVGAGLAALPWLTAFVRSDRRTGYDLVSGVRVGTNAPVKGDFEWKVDTSTPRSS
jgi:hypothetical protein